MLFGLKKKFAALASVAVAAPVLVLSAAGAADAASTITWTSASTGLCLSYGINEFDTGIAGTHTIHTGACSAPGWNSASWIDGQVSSGIWLEHPDVDTSECLTADGSVVYFEACDGSTGNNWERWREIHSGSSWYLQNVESGLYLESNSDGQVYMGATKEAWH